ncbi:MAG: hypothetical protein ACXWP5_04755 [Bdellovibrionota bacterium]
MNKRVILLALPWILSACDYPTSLAELKARILGTPAPSTPVSDENDPLAGRSKANAELLKEMFLVVYGHEPTDQTIFVSMLGALNQGASLEGVYNGFAHSAVYRKLESDNPSASAEALRVFGEELALFEVELPELTKFDARSAQPLATPVQPTGEEETPTEITFLPKEVTATPSPEAEREKLLAVLPEKYSKLFVTASIFTLKRVLADEALKVVAARREYREKLALWYSKWAVHMAGRKIDFGIPLRNKAEEAFHYKWALEVTEDRVIWEVLNRVHRLLNEANRQKQ